MSWKRTIQRTFRSVTGLHVGRIDPSTVPSPRGVHLEQDLARAFPGFQPACIADVGANIGQSAERFLAWFPSARILCFEPGPEAFRNLQQRFGSHPRTRLVHAALGRAPGRARMIVGADTALARVETQPEDPDAAGNGAPGSGVPVDSLDRFCGTSGIERIGFLKIDTEGHDLEVLHGARELLASQRIDLVQVEAGMHPENRVHVPFARLKEHLESTGYRVFGLYDQHPEWTTGEAHLRRVDAVFASNTLLSAHRRTGDR